MILFSMGKQKHFLEKVETKRALLISFLVALILFSLDAIRYAIKIALDQLIQHPELAKATDALSYAIGFTIAVIVLLILIHKYSKDL